LRLVLGSSMGGMHCWMWGGMYPGFMDALVPIASQLIAISGRNWLSRRIAIEAIRNDPDYNNGNYTTKPMHYIRTAPFASLMTENAVRLQEMAPTREAAEKLYQDWMANVAKGDANDQLYATEAVIGYDPVPLLPKITARLLAINFADDDVNPPELGVVEPAIAKIRGAKFILVPAGPETHGYFTHLRAAIWKPYLAEFMRP
jgi:homoserine O-acetyltransferase